MRGLKWISCLKPDNPKKEISQLLEAIDIIKNDGRNKSIITDYQFISVILSLYDFSPSHVWFINHVVHQKKESKHFKKYKLFLITNINADYRLNAIIMYQNQPLAGLDMTANLLVKYCLINQNSNEEIWTKDINSIYTAKFSDSLIGMERLNMANEGAIRKNIEILLQTLAVLEL